MIALRGATTIINNTAEEIEKASIELFQELINRNNINIKDITSIIFSCTQDITKAYPGKFVREYFNLGSTAIMHFNEMYVEDSLKLCIRILLLLEAPLEDIKYVYLREAAKLRPDLNK